MLYMCSYLLYTQYTLAKLPSNAWGKKAVTHAKTFANCIIIVSVCPRNRLCADFLNMSPQILQPLWKNKK